MGLGHLHLAPGLAYVFLAHFCRPFNKRIAKSRSTLDPLATRTRHNAARRDVPHKSIFACLLILEMEEMYVWMKNGEW